MTRVRRPIALLCLTVLLGLAGRWCFHPSPPASPTPEPPAPEHVAFAHESGVAPFVDAEAPAELPPEVFARKKAGRRAQRAATMASARTGSLPADAIEQFPDADGVQREYAIALDEVFIPAENTLRSMPPAGSLDEHLARLRLLKPEASMASGDSENWRRSPAPRLVLYPRLGPRTQATRRIVTPGITLALASSSAPLPEPRPDLGITRWERVGYATGQAIARVAGDPAQPLRALRALVTSAQYAGARPLLARAHEAMAVPEADLFSRQWHLRNTGQGGGTRGIDLRAVPAWDLATGRGVTIGVVDGAFDRYHLALGSSLDLDLAQDWIGGDEAPWTSENESDENHATAVAGLALAPGFRPADAAAGTPPSSRVSGVAPRARLAALRLIGGYTTEEDDAEAMIWEPGRIAVKNNSWGPYPFADELYPLPPLFRSALESAVAEGRDGLGTIFVWSAGNGRAEGFQGPKNAYAANRQVIAVAAVDRNGAPSYFSDGGPHILVSAPGNGAGKGAVALTTTDRTGLKGYNGKYITGADLADQDYTNSFRGTSASAPLVSGVAALLLELRPDLGWRDVQEILMSSATELKSSDKAWSRRAASPAGFRIKHHPRFGAGLVNAERALRLAQDWTPLPAEQKVEGTLGGGGGVVSLPDGERAFADYAFKLDSSAPLRVEHVELTLDIHHAYRGDLTIQLVSPDGVVSEFVTRTYEDDAADYPAFTFSSVRHWGENSLGSGKNPQPWTLRIKDDVYGDAGYLRNAKLRLHGVPIAAPVITRQLADARVYEGNPLILSFAASGTDLTYAWYRNGKLARQTSGPVYFVAKPTRADLAAAYHCVVKNGLGSVSTATARASSESASINLYGESGVNLDYSPSNPFPVPAKWSLENAHGYTIGADTGRITGYTSTYSNFAGYLVARSGDRVVRRPISFFFTSGSYIPTSIYDGFAEIDSASGKKVAVTAWLWAIGGGNLSIQGQDDAGNELTLSVSKIELFTRGDGLTRLRSSDAVRFEGIVFNRSNPDISVSSTVRVGEHEFPITFRRSLTSSFLDETAIAAYSGTNVFALTPATPDPRLPPGTSLGRSSLSGWSQPSLSLYAADGAVSPAGDSVCVGGYVFINRTFSTTTHRNRMIGWLKLPATGGATLQGAVFWSRSELADPFNFDAPGCFAQVALKVEGGRVPETLDLNYGLAAPRLALDAAGLELGDQFASVADLALPVPLTVTVPTAFYSGPAPVSLRLYRYAHWIEGSASIIIPPELASRKLSLLTMRVPGKTSWPGFFHLSPPGGDAAGGNLLGRAEIRAAP